MCMILQAIKPARPAAQIDPTTVSQEDDLQEENEEAEGKEEEEDDEYYDDSYDPFPDIFWPLSTPAAESAWKMRIISQSSLQEMEEDPNKVAAKWFPTQNKGQTVLWASDWLEVLKYNFLISFPWRNQSQSQSNSQSQSISQTARIKGKEQIPQTYTTRVILIQQISISVKELNTTVFVIPAWPSLDFGSLTLLQNCFCTNQKLTQDYHWTYLHQDTV